VSTRSPSIQFVTRWLDERCAAAGKSPGWTAPALSRLVDDWLREALASVLADDELLELIAARSYAHVNGYDKIVLVDRRPRYALHLHLWWPGAQTGSPEHIHNHPWTFSTALLSGGYRTRFYRIAPSGHPLYRYTCTSTLGQPGHTLEPNGMVAARCVFDAHVTVGARYTIRRSVLHRISNLPRELTSTLMLHSRIVDARTTLLTEAPLETHGRVEVASFGAPTLRRKLNAYLDHLRRPVGAPGEQREESA